MKIENYRFKTNPPITLPVIRFKGKKKGKTGFISGGIHGDELNGMMLVKNFVDNFEDNNLEAKMSGELIIMPVLNPTGFEHAHRRAKPDNGDLNRAFATKKRATFSRKFARELMKEFIAKADFGIDCHDAGTDSSLLLHTRVSSRDSEDYDSATQDLGRLFGTEIIIERKGKRGMMALEAWKQHKVPILTVEMGGAKHIFEDYIKLGVDGIKNILKFYKVLPGTPKVPDTQFVLKGRFGVEAPETGILELNVKLGDSVHAGDKIGWIYHPQTFTEEPILSPMCGRVFSLHDHQIVQKGGLMFSVLETKKCHIERMTAGRIKKLGKMDAKKILM